MGAEPEWLSTVQAAALIPCSRQTVINLIDSGKLHGVRAGVRRYRIRPEWLAAYRRGAAASGPRLTSRQRLVLDALIGLADDGVDRPRQKQVIERAGVAQSTASYSLQRLAQYGLVRFGDDGRFMLLRNTTEEVSSCT